MTLQNGTVEVLTCTPELKDFVARCVDIPKFLTYCEACPNYARRWSCPPFAFDPMAIWQGHSALRLIAHVLRPGPDWTPQRALEALETEKAAFWEQLLRQEAQTPGALALSPGNCTLCGVVCSRVAGKPCRRPERLRRSIEALGGDVALTMSHYFDLPLLWIKDGQVPAYLTLVGGLLLEAER